MFGVKILMVVELIMVLLVIIQVQEILLDVKVKTENEGDNSGMENSTLICLVSHPTVDPELITEKLALKPSMTQKYGDQIITPKGNKINGSYKVTKWSYIIELKNNESLFGELDSLVNYLFSYRDFFCDIQREGGSSIVYLNLSDHESLSFELSPDIMKKIFEMKMSFGFEIFK